MKGKEEAGWNLGWISSRFANKSARTKSFAVLVAALFIIPILLGPGILNLFNHSDADPNPITYDRFITYHSNTTEDKSLTVGYSGIAATEYNPEYWADTVDGTSSSYSNWTGDTVSLSGLSDYSVTNHTIMLAFWLADGSSDGSSWGTVYKIKMPEGSRINYILDGYPDSGGVKVLDRPDSGYSVAKYTEDGTIIKFNSNAPTDSDISNKSNTIVKLSADGSHILIRDSDKNFAVKIFLNIDCELSQLNKVFAGWSTDANGTDTVYPGDVIKASKDENSPTDLYAKWIVPDSFLLKKDVYDLRALNTSLWGENGVGYTIETITPYANLSNVWARDGNCNVEGWQYIEAISLKYYDEDTTTEFKGAYDKVIPGWNDNQSVKRTAPDMFGTIYHINGEHACKNRNYEYHMNISGTGKEGQIILKTLPAGTYRSTDSIASMVFDGSGPCNMSGDIIIDNMRMDSEARSSTHGDGNNASLYANGHKLIMGTGIVNKSFNPNSPPNVSDGRNAPQIVGGTLGDGDDITEAAITGKKIVFSDDEDTDSDDNDAVDLATFVIVHSGVYANIVSGSKGGGNVIGSAENPLSTYLVLKGGSTIDTIVGGSSKGSIYGMSGNDATRYSGGTYVYLIDHFTPGDDYEDIQSGWYSDDYSRNGYTILESSIIQGGCTRIDSGNRYSAIHGATHVFATGTSSLWDVQGGGRSDGTQTDVSYVEISGHSVIRHVACGTITDGAKTRTLNTVDDVIIRVKDSATVANVFGAGYDTWDSPTNSSMTEGTITVNIEGGTVGNVYGGGYRGTVGVAPSNSDQRSVTIHVNIIGGKILQNVYGGGSGGVDKIKHNPDGTHNASSARLYSMGRSLVFGDIYVTVGGSAQVNGNVYGGGMAVPKLQEYSGVTGFQQEANNYTIYNKATRMEVATVYGSTHVTVQDGAQVKGSVYGAGRGIGTTYSQLDTVYSGTVGSDPSEFDMARIYMISKNNDGDYVYSSIPWFTYLDDGVAKYRCEYDASLFEATADSGIIEENSRYLNFAKVVGSSEVIIKLDPESSVSGNVYAGSAYGKVDGDTRAIVKSGTLEKDLFGGGQGREGINSVSGTRTVYIEGDDSIARVINPNDSTKNSISGVRILGSVYGGSSVGDDGPSTHTVANFTNTTVIVRSGYIARDVFGGGLLGGTYGSATLYIGHIYDPSTGDITPYTKITAADAGINTSNIVISIDNAYAGGNVNTDAGEGSVQNPYTTYLVKGSGSVYINGDEGDNDISITGSVMASGNSCLTANKTLNNSFTTYIQMDGFENRAESMTGIHRADTLLINQSILNITGRSPLVLIGNVQKLTSIYGVEVMILKNGSHISVDEPIDCVATLRSLDKNNSTTAVTSPLNEIRFQSGSTFYVRDTTLAYGPVSGFTVLSVDSQKGYGAYVLGNATASTGGFVIMRDGSYDRADYSDTSDVRCWYISGISKKIMTMTLPAAASATEQRYVESSIEFQKLLSGTDIKFTGGSFTPAASNDYIFLRPGTASTEGNKPLGLIVGYKGENETPSANRYYSNDLRQLSIDNTEAKWLYGTYLTEDHTDVGLENKKEGGSITGLIVRPLTPNTLVTNPNTKVAGIYSIDLLFTAAHESQTSYIGYVILYLQESTTITYDVVSGDTSIQKTNELVTNTIEIRIDLYTSGGSAETIDSTFNMIMKTEEEPDGSSSGQMDLMVPSGMRNGTVYLDSIEYVTPEGKSKSVFEEDFNSHCTITVAAVANQDKTTGWSNSYGLVQCSDGMASTHIGTLIGSIPATIRFYISDFYYTSDGYTPAGEHPVFKLTFHVEDTAYTLDPHVIVNTTVKEKELIPVTFHDMYRNEPTILYFYEGTYITEASTPSTEPFFIGWYYKGTDFANRFDFRIPVTKAISLEARYSYMVTFDNMNGTYSTMFVASLYSGATLDSSSVPNPKMVGYTFKGWCLDRDCSRMWDYTSDVITHDTTLYAKWSGNEALIHFWYTDGNGVLQKFVGYDDTSDMTEYNKRHVDPSEDGFYVMMYIGTQAVHPTVSYGSTFNTIDPKQSNALGYTINILDFAETQVEKKIGNSKFICWQAYKNGVVGSSAFSVYADTVLAGDIAMDGEGHVLQVINLYAVTATVAIELNMTDNSKDASVHIAAPSTFLVYPDDVKPENVIPVYSFNDGGSNGYHNVLYLIYNNQVYWRSFSSTSYISDGYWKNGGSGDNAKMVNIQTRGVLLYIMDASTVNETGDPEGEIRYYPDGNGNWYCVENEDYRNVFQRIGNYFFTYDKYGNYYTRNGIFNSNGWSKELSMVYSTVDSVEHTYILKKNGDWYILKDGREPNISNNNNSFVLSSDDWESTTAPADYYFKDKYGNRYVAVTTAYEESQYANNKNVTPPGGTQKTEYYYYVHDGFGQYFKAYVDEDPSNNKWIVRHSIVYRQVDSVEHVYLIDHSTDKWYEYYQTGVTPTPTYSSSKNSWDYASEDTTKWTEYTGDKTGYCYKDRDGTHYLNIPSSHSAKYRCIYGSESYYIFTFELNEATRSGYQLTGWHNDRVDESDDRYPGAGVHRTLDIFFVKIGGHQVVNREVLHTTDNTGAPNLYETIDFQKMSRDERFNYVDDIRYGTCPRIDNPSKVYGINYIAQWKAVDYTVSIGSMAHGTIRAFYVDSGDMRHEFTTKTDLHYGDRIEISYTPSGNYEFSKWFITGEYILSPADIPSTTMIVQGNSTISVLDIGERIVTVQIKFDNGRFENATDRKNTTAFLKDKETGEYYELDYIQDTMDAYETYHAYVPLGEYTLCLRYNIGEVPINGNPIDFGHNEYELMGDVVVDAIHNTEYNFYVLTARIVDYAMWDDGVNYDDESDYEGFTIVKRTILVDNSGSQVLRISKYTGVSAEYIDVDPSMIAFIINNPDNSIPPVYFTVAPGYTFHVYEGFPDDGLFNVNDINVYPYGSTIDGLEYQGRFDLNWTRYDAPADVVIKKIQKTPVRVTYDVMGPDGDTSWKEYKDVNFNTSVLKYLAGSTLLDKTVAGWYYDTSGTKAVMNTAVLNNSVIHEFGLDGVPAIALSDAVYKDQFGNIYTYEAGVHTLAQSFVFKDNESVTEEYKIVYGNPAAYYKKVNGEWEPCSEVTLYYFEDNNGNKFALDRSGAYRCFEINGDNCTLHAKLATETKTIDIVLKEENTDGTFAATNTTLVLTKDGGVFEGKYVLDRITGFSDTIVIAEAGDCTITQRVEDGRIIISISDSSSSETPVSIELRHMRITTDLVWNKVWDSDPGSDVSSDGWTYDSVTNKFKISGARYGQTVTMPKIASGDAIVEWVSSPSVNVDYNSTLEVFTYTLLNTDSDITITFTSVTQTVNVSFVTYKSSFVNGYSSYTVSIPKGMSFGGYDSEEYSEESDIRKIFRNLDAFESATGCTFNGFKTQDRTVTFSIDLVFSSDTTFIAEWSINKFDLTIRKGTNWEETTQVSATKDSSQNLLKIYDATSAETIADTTNHEEYNSEIIVFIVPSSGMTLDYEATLAASKLAGTSGTFNFGEPTKLSEERGFRWSFLLTDDVNFVICFKEVSVNVDFYVNGIKTTDLGNIITYDYESASVYKTGNGQNMPMYSLLHSISNYDGGEIGWYTNPECTVLFNPMDYLIMENLSLYTYSTYVVVFHDNDGSGPRKFMLEDSEGIITLPVYTYDMAGKHANHIHVGWATNTGLENAKNIFMYISEDKLPTGDFNNKWLDLYAYYLRDGTLLIDYDGNEHPTPLYNDDTERQDGIDTDDIIVYYSKTVEFDDSVDYTQIDPPGDWSKTPVTITLPDSIRVHFWLKITSSTDNTDTIAGAYTITVRPTTIYVIAPTLYKIDDGRGLTVAAGDVRFYTYHTENDPDDPGKTIDRYYKMEGMSGISNIVFSEAEGYGYHLDDVGVLRTSVTIQFTNPADAGLYSLVYIDGTIAIYSSDSVKFESWGAIA